MLNQKNVTNRNFEQEKRRKQLIRTGAGFYLPGLLGIFTLFPIAGMVLIIIGTLLILRLFFISPSKPSLKELLSNRVISNYEDIFDFLLLMSFFGLLFGALFDFFNLFHSVFYLDFSQL